MPIRVRAHQRKGRAVRGHFRYEIVPTEGPEYGVRLYRRGENLRMQSLRPLAYVEPELRGGAVVLFREPTTDELLERGYTISRVLVHENLHQVLSRIGENYASRTLDRPAYKHAHLADRRGGV